MEPDTRLLAQLVDRLTDKRELDPSPDALARLKRLCRAGGDEAVRAAFYLLFERLKDGHARVRLHAVTVADELFRRSSAFRSAISDAFSEFLELAVGFKAARPLPPPQADAVRLREAALACVERWDEEHGALYPQVRMGRRYLRDVVRMRFPELRATQAAREAEAAAREERSRQLTLERYGAIRREYVSALADMEVVLDEMEASFRLLEQRPEPLPAADADDEWEDVAPPEFNAGEPAAEAGPSDAAAAAAAGGGGRGSPPPQLRNADPAVLDALRGAHKLVSGRHLPTVLDWLRTVVRADVGEPGSAEHRRRERILRAAIAVRDRMMRAAARCEALMAAAQQAGLQGGSGEAQLVVSASTDALGRTAAVASVSRAASGSSPAPAERKRKAAALADVFGSDSDEEHVRPPSRRGSSQSLSSAGRPRPRPSPVSPPQYFDPTYRRQLPPGAAAAASDVLKEDLVAAAASQAAAAQPQPLPGLAAERAARAAKSALPEAVRKRLLAEAPAIPSGNHLAHWDSDRASLMNARGMEFQNHWGPVDAGAELPDHVVSQFFTTRATYYEPAAAQGAAAPKREQPPAQQARDAEASPPRKRPAPVTAIGHGGVTNSANLASFLRRQPKQPGPLAAAPAGPSGDGAPHADGATQPAAGVAAAPEGPGGGSKRSSPSAPAEPAAVAPHQPRQPATSPAAQPQAAAAAGAAAAPGPSGGQAARQPSARERAAQQRAADRAHNAAVLGELGGDDETIARNLAEHELQALAGGGRGRGGRRKERAPVRARLAQKLLNGGATARAIQDLDAAEHEKFREIESRRW